MIPTDRVLRRSARTFASAAPRLALGAMDPEESALVAAAGAGDREALAALVEKYHRPALASVHRWLRPRSAEDADDHVQEIFAKFGRGVATFRPDRGTKFSTWFYAYVRNYCLDVLKRRRLKVVPISQDDGGPVLDLRAAEPAPAAAVESAELKHTLELAIDSLPREEREIFIKREVEGLDYEQITRGLGIPRATAKGRLYRAKETLRVLLRPYLRGGRDAA